MPRLLGLEPEKWRPIAIAGGGLLVVLLLLRGRSGSAPVVQSGGALTSSGAALAQGEADAQEAAVRQLQFQEMEKESVFAQAMRSLQLQEARSALGARQAELDLEATIYRRQADVIRTKPVSCPHGSEVRLYPDGTPYCRSSKGAVNLRNTVIDPAADAVKKVVRDATEYYLRSQTGTI